MQLLRGPQPEGTCWDDNQKQIHHVEDCKAPNDVYALRQSLLTTKLGFRSTNLGLNKGTFSLRRMIHIVGNTKTLEICIVRPTFHESRRFNTDTCMHCGIIFRLWNVDKET